MAKFFACWVILHAFVSSVIFVVLCVCLFIFKLPFSKISFRNTISVSNSLDSNQARRFVGPDLDLNCLQRISADDTTRQRDNMAKRAVHAWAVSTYEKKNLTLR